jgi:hypothetical protein
MISALRLRFPAFAFLLPFISLLSFAQPAASHFVSSIDTTASKNHHKQGHSSISENLLAQSLLRPVEGVINNDRLVTVNGIPWAAAGWRFSRLFAIERDSIDSTIIGRVVLDRHGEDNQPILGIREPFAGPRPGRVVFVSGWGSNDDGCFVELMIQVARTLDERVDPRLIVPTQLDMMVNGQRLTLTATTAPDVQRYGMFPYNYVQPVNRGGEWVSVNLQGVWSMSRHVFVLNARQAQILSSAPAQNVPIRITLANLSPITFPIGKGTVERWSGAYGFNPACTRRRTR